MYAQEVKRMWQAGLDYRDGYLLTSRVRGSVYDCLLDTIVIGPDGLRDRNLDVSFFSPDEGKFRVMATGQHCILAVSRSSNSTCNCR